MKGSPRDTAHVRTCSQKLEIVRNPVIHSDRIRVSVVESGVRLTSAALLLGTESLVALTPQVSCIAHSLILVSSEALCGALSSLWAGFRFTGFQSSRRAGLGVVAIRFPIWILAQTGGSDRRSERSLEVWNRWRHTG